MMHGAGRFCKKCATYLDGVAHGGLENLCGGETTSAGTHTLVTSVPPLPAAELRMLQKLSWAQGPGCRVPGGLTTRIQARASDTGVGSTWRTIACGDISEWDGELESLPEWPGDPNVCSSPH